MHCLAYHGSDNRLFNSSVTSLFFCFCTEKPFHAIQLNLLICHIQKEVNCRFTQAFQFLNKGKIKILSVSVDIHFATIANSQDQGFYHVRPANITSLSKQFLCCFNHWDLIIQSVHGYMDKEDGKRQQIMMQHTSLLGEVIWRIILFPLLCIWKTLTPAFLSSAYKKVDIISTQSFNFFILLRDNSETTWLFA